MNINEEQIPRPEYPRPQFIRKQWLNLNGIWQFEIDNGNSGKNRNFYERENLDNKIVVPFCPESRLSGVEYKDFMTAVWYKKKFEIPKKWIENKIILHFGAADYYTEVWINGISIGTHKGGYSSFSFDITKYVNQGINTIVVCTEDDVRSGLQPRGKQSALYNSHDCDYTRTTGIWQTVWLECVPDTYIKLVKYYPNVKDSSLHVKGLCEGDIKNKKVLVKAGFKGTKVGESTVELANNNFDVTILLSETYLWETANPNLYNLNLYIMEKDKIIDEVESYFGLRNIELTDNEILINGKPVFQRLVLDQGFYPDGIYTAPSDDDLKRDIEISMGLGFNGARLHEKIFEPRFLYWADKLGYIVWGEHANWGLDITSAEGIKHFLPEWMEILDRDFNHPSIVGWCPFNETWDYKGSRQDDDVLKIVYKVTKAVDTTRPVIDTSGNFHVITDIYDVHDYEQDVNAFYSHYEPLEKGEKPFERFVDRQQYKGQPFFISEYGGIKWSNDNESIGWGYGNVPKTEKDFILRYKGLTESLLNNSKVCAFCYTQLYDIEQEVNGLYTYDRKPKFNTEIFKAINSQKAAIER